MCTKQIKELETQIEFKKESIEQNNEALKERSEHLEHKKGELQDILKETENEENELLKNPMNLNQKLTSPYLFHIKKLDQVFEMALAVVAVDRGASAGSFFTIPPQVQLDIASRKKLITDEHSGRILVDKELADEESLEDGKIIYKPIILFNNK